ncbi:CBS domain-containing protein [Streptomyces sp. FIT100]|uniref:CBS domain-containing protein n=1 Tax=Streptomyces sp. FIT100 TaxID=2837956 RepID=UPI0021C73F6E|nr:CBS domain-containing protein [Streptomyces sp. FIT100]UUN28157.1 CBS domain-containing protein [Streptomyces sp. FIT100]
MRARDLAVEYEYVTVDSDALAGSQMIKVLVPEYVIEDPTLAAVVDEKHADRLCRSLIGRRVGDCLPRNAPAPPVADPDDTALEVAALMSRVRSPLVAVAERSGTGTTPRLLGVITAAHLLHELLREVDDPGGAAGPHP